MPRNSDGLQQEVYVAAWLVSACWEVMGRLGLEGSSWVCPHTQLSHGMTMQALVCWFLATSGTRHAMAGGGHGQDGAAAAVIRCGGVILE
mmetsp:Transcript_7353/g.18249  ORF Transcript_7353/g.18249 Transcript_7353/m.18249 type:complete len:90 (+) Transcript_7353:41-310(+)